MTDGIGILGVAFVAVLSFWAGFLRGIKTGRDEATQYERWRMKHEAFLREGELLLAMAKKGKEAEDVA
jgi:hypothetical protein